MIADGSRVAVVEIGPGSGYSVQSIKEGRSPTRTTISTTGSLPDNIVMGVLSRKRLARIEELLSDAPKPFCFDDFLAFAADRRDGPSDSIFRVGDLSNRERTVATFIARVASDGTASSRSLSTIRVKRLCERTILQPNWILPSISDDPRFVAALRASSMNLS